MAKGLVEALSDEFEAGQYTDEYRKAVEQVIEDKAAGRTIVYEEEPKSTGTVIDLSAALEASLAEARAAKDRHPSATSAKKTAAKKTRARKSA